MVQHRHKETNEELSQIKLSFLKNKPNWKSLFFSSVWTLKNINLHRSCQHQEYVGIAGDQ